MKAMISIIWHPAEELMQKSVSQASQNPDTAKRNIASEKGYGFSVVIGPGTFH